MMDDSETRVASHCNATDVVKKPGLAIRSCYYIWSCVLVDPVLQIICQLYCFIEGLFNFILLMELKLRLNLV